MVTPRSSTQPAGAPVDEASHRAQVGTELLAQGKLSEARIELELAIAGQPKNQRLQSSLALTCFKLGVLDRAAELYELLVRENPVEPTLRVNLGLVYLKLGSVPDAVRELQTSVDLAPEHKKAQNYLGLALAQAGELESAREAFVAAGSTQMVEKMTAALADRAAASPAPAAVAEPELEVAVEPPVTEPEAAPAELSIAQQSFVEIEGEAVGVNQLPLLPTPPPVPPRPITASPAPAPRRPITQVPVIRPQLHIGGAIPGALLSDVAHSLRIAPVQVEVFHIEAGMVGIRVQGEMLTRLENMVCTTGQLTFQPEMKRFRGRATDKPFGKGPRRIMRAAGTGTIWAADDKRFLLPIDLGDSSAYFSEEIVFAFEEALTFENGRLAGKNVLDVNLIHLRGRGKVLLSIPGPLRSIEVGSGVTCTVAVEHLVGWLGTLTPRLVFTAQEVEGGPPAIAVELSGEGFALVALAEPR